MMRKLMEAGKGRTANKLRSYVRAAYQTARAAKSKPSIPLKFKSYGVVHNPAADTEPDESQNKADKNPLNLDDLRKYWAIIKKVPGLPGAALRVHLLAGGQRIEQLVKLRTADIGGDTITLYDGKGRPGKPPRPHTVPLLPQAAAALKECKPTGEYALSTTAGTKPLAATTLSRWAQDLAIAIPEFQAKRIRSGVEKLLASQKVSKDIRGRLQSHGVSGVQARHYDGHEYIGRKARGTGRAVREPDAQSADQGRRAQGHGQQENTPPCGIALIHTTECSRPLPTVLEAGTARASARTRCRISVSRSRHPGFDSRMLPSIRGFFALRQ